MTMTSEMILPAGSTKMKAKVYGYWVSTSLVAFMLLTSGAGHLAHMKQSVDGIMALGYPLYFITLLGFWKLAGGIAILAPGLARLKEWAYAGIIFDLSSASVSHAARGSETFHVIVPLLIACIALTSWALRPPTRVLGVISPAKAS